MTIEQKRREKRKGGLKLGYTGIGGEQKVGFGNRVHWVWQKGILLWEGFRSSYDATHVLTITVSYRIEMNFYFFRLGTIVKLRLSISDYQNLP
jgi:hypothetical protein